MTTVSVTTSGLQTVALRLKALPDAMRASIVAAVTKETIRLEGILKEDTFPNLPIKKGDSFRRIVRSIHSQIDDGSSSVTGTVGSQGAFTPDGFNLVAGLENGTVAHEIRAKKVLALAFMLGGALRFFKRVHHPGTPAYKPFASTLAKEGPGILSRLKSDIQQGFKS